MDEVKTNGGKLYAFVESKKFNNFIIAVILINSVIIGLETYSSIANSSIGAILKTVDQICLGIFVVELLLKFAVYRFSFFKSPTNIFDFFIVLTSILSNLFFLSVFRVMRVFRVFRTLRSLRSLRSLRMISGLERLKTLVVALEKSLASIIWTVLLLGIMYYILAVVGIGLFGEKFPELFGTLNGAFYTLFQAMTLESWATGICTPVMEEYPLAWLYFIPFVVVSAFVMMNLVVGILVNTIAEATDEAKREKVLDNKKVSTSTLRAEIEVFKKQIEKVEILVEDYDETIAKHKDISSGDSIESKK